MLDHEALGKKDKNKWSIFVCVLNWCVFISISSRSVCLSTANYSYAKLRQEKHLSKQSNQNPNEQLSVQYVVWQVWTGSLNVM